MRLVFITRPGCGGGDSDGDGNGNGDRDGNNDGDSDGDGEVGWYTIVRVRDTLGIGVRVRIC